MKAGIILAGGKAERFGSDKALAKLNGEVLIKHVHSALKESVDKVFICVDIEEKIRKYRFLKDDITEFIVDMAEDFSRGPLRGILTGVRNIEGEYFLVTSTDVPFIKPEAIDILFEKAQNVEAALPVWSTSIMEPLFAVYSQKAVESISDYMHRYSTTTGKNPWAIDLIRSLDKISLIEVRNIDSTLGSFININTKDMLESLNYTGAEEANKQVKGNGGNRILVNKPA
ncbi:molybdenum cofactor guanylyltransferase [archaeon]|nr:molybdenum cofactor guanylyltransferase [archaeon]